MKNIIKPKDAITTDKKREIADKLEEEYSKTEMALSEIDAADQKEAFLWAEHEEPCISAVLRRF